ncbi:MAG: hypothetical protein EZS28_016785 [Streblomastix strix]|uniref:Uncharacterized protein n=1 Tax=Streblomastix strix TaxID=222440 RepID=A0A5J4VZL9_9EUKA|nr:MAG: hypothetical protein EZS28_016785 [Streblomastix strix]
MTSAQNKDQLIDVGLLFGIDLRWFPKKVRRQNLSALFGKYQIKKPHGYSTDLKNRVKAAVKQRQKAINQQNQLFEKQKLEEVQKQNAQRRRHEEEARENFENLRQFVQRNDFDNLQQQRELQEYKDEYQRKMFAEEARENFENLRYDYSNLQSQRELQEFKEEQLRNERYQRIHDEFNNLSDLELRTFRLLDEEIAEEIRKLDYKNFREIDFEDADALMLTEPFNQTVRYDEDGIQEVSYDIRYPHNNILNALNPKSLIDSQEKLEKFIQYLPAKIIENQERIVEDTLTRFVAIVQMVVVQYRNRAGGAAPAELQKCIQRQEVKFVDNLNFRNNCLFDALSFVSLPDETQICADRKLKITKRRPTSSRVAEGTIQCGPQFISEFCFGAISVASTIKSKKGLKSIYFDVRSNVYATASARRQIASDFLTLETGEKVITQNFIQQWLEALFEEAVQIKQDNMYDDPDVPYDIAVPVFQVAYYQLSW